MDRSKWEYKKLGEVCAPKTDILRANKLFGKDDVIEYIDISSIDNSAHYITQPTSYLFHEAPSRAQQKVEQGDILYSLVRPNLKNIAVVTSSNTEKYVASSGFCVLRSKDIDNRYLYHLVLSNPFTDYILGLVSGANYPAVREDDVKGFYFRCPSIADQHRIVAELDCLNEMIAVKQEQLKEFDKLAQYIFYDMFGDPVVNPNRWESKTLERLIQDNIILYHLDGNHGGDYPRREEFVEQGVSYIGANNIKDGYIDFSGVKYLTEEKANTLRKGIAKNEDVLFAHNATVGPVALLRTTEEKVVLSTSLTAYRCNKQSLLPLFLKSYMGSTWFVNQYIHTMKQATRNQVPITQQRKMSFILPPLSLQQQFADKISAIEAQKELVKQSIAETQHLLDYTMDNYFG